MTGWSSVGCWPRPFAGLGPDGITVVALARQQDIFLAERVGLGAVGDLTAGQAERYRPTFGIDERGDFARQPARGCMLVNTETG